MTTTAIELAIEGMTCGHCGQTVRKALRAAPGVVDATVDVPRGRARVTLAVEAPRDTDGLRRAVEEAGYAVTALDRS